MIKERRDYYVRRLMTTFHGSWIWGIKSIHRYKY